MQQRRVDEIFRPPEAKRQAKEAASAAVAAVPVPLAERVRPRTLSEVVGQDAAIGPGTQLRSLIESGRLPSMLFWGPPGVGKTTVGRIVAAESGAKFLLLSAATCGVKEVKQAIADAIAARRRTVVFLDEIHRFSKLQQDSLLRAVEDGTVCLIGATTENPSFEVNSALLSRCRVVQISRLEQPHLEAIVRRALEKEKATADDDAVSLASAAADGDARRVLNVIESALASSGDARHVSTAAVREALSSVPQLYDKKGEGHYNIISALHKSMRGSDVDASLYWLMRMIEAGEDPLFIARRLVRFASEDVGLADPNAMPQAVAAFSACHFIGYPECDVILGQAVAYLALAPKSIAVYEACAAAREAARRTGSLPVPLHICNAPTGMMQAFGYGRGYIYTPAAAAAGLPTAQEYLPPELRGAKFWHGLAQAAARGETEDAERRMK